VRVANFHDNTLRATVDLMEACGFRTLQDITPDKVFRRVEQSRVMSFREIYFNKPASRAAHELNQQYKLN
jgi:hypothetical protein